MLYVIYIYIYIGILYTTNTNTNDKLYCVYIYIYICTLNGDHMVCTMRYICIQSADISGIGYHGCLRTNSKP